MYFSPKKHTLTPTPNPLPTLHRRWSRDSRPSVATCWPWARDSDRTAGWKGWPFRSGSFWNGVTKIAPPKKWLKINEKLHWGYFTLLWALKNSEGPYHDQHGITWRSGCFFSNRDTVTSLAEQQILQNRMFTLYTPEMGDLSTSHFFLTHIGLGWGS